MRTRSIALNYTCNHACTFCTIRRAEDDPAAIAHAVVRRQIAEAGDVRELILSGGEPTLRRDLVKLVASARASSVVLETNGTLLDGTRVAELAQAGVSAMRVHVPALGPALAAITRDDDAPSDLERGLRAIVAQRMTLDVATPIVRSNVAIVAQLPAQLIALLGPSAIRTMFVHVPTHAADLSELVSYDEAAKVLLDVVAAARAVGLAIKLSPGCGPPPCVFPHEGRPTQLYSLAGKPAPSDRQVHVDACSDCRMRESCVGLSIEHVARFGRPAMRPIVEERMRRRLSLIHTVEEQIARELVTPGGRVRDASTREEQIIRVNFHCNQACDFCYVSTHLPAPHNDAVLNAIRSALSAGNPIVISGGEPTLNPRLVEYLKLAVESPYPVELQTNAVKLADRELARAVVETGVQRAFVSLHGATAAVSDAVTRAPGTFDKTILGIDNLHALGLELRLNFVICRVNAAELPAMIELVADRWPRASVSISFVAQSTDVVPRDRDLMPRYADVMPFVADALERGRARGVAISGFESMCGLPLCLVPVDRDELFALPEVADANDEFVKTGACAQCSLGSRCYGIRRGYVDLHGADELQAINR